MGSRWTARVVGVLVMVGAMAGCTENGPTTPEPSPTATLTANATGTIWTYVDLATPAVEHRDLAGAATSTAWDVAFNATGVRLNGGANGPAGVVGYCLCQNATATSAQVLAMTPDLELADFEAVRASDIPAATAAGWSNTIFDATDVVGSAGPKWYKYNLLGTNQITPTFNVYLIRRGTEVYKVQLTGYYSAAGAPRWITVRYAKLAD